MYHERVNVRAQRRYARERKSRASGNVEPALPEWFLNVSPVQRAATACARISFKAEIRLNPFVTLGLLLLAVWAVLWLGFHIVAGAIHLLVLVAVGLIVWGLVKKGARAIDNQF